MIFEYGENYFAPICLALDVKINIFVIVPKRMKMLQSENSVAIFGEEQFFLLDTFWCPSLKGESWTAKIALMHALSFQAKEWSVA